MHYTFFIVYHAHYVNRYQQLFSNGSKVTPPPGPVNLIDVDTAVSQSYREFVLEQLGRVTPVSGRSMFGGVGIYAQKLFFALIAEDRLYFKVDDATRPEFQKRGMEPFRPFGEDSAMGYFEVPADVVEDVAVLETWMKKAIDVAAAAKSGKIKRSKR
jgi:DNA transformation protein and related proteins